jgi:hypothetical protein
VVFPGGIYSAYPLLITYMFSLAIDVGSTPAKMIAIRLRYVLISQACAVCC